MNGKDFNEVVSLILNEDSRYDRGAYYFIREALDYTVKQRGKSKANRSNRHVDGSDLSKGARDYALEQYGPMAATLLDTWGVRSSADFGEIVFNLVEYNVFGTQESDRREDFKNVFDFHEAFEAPFLPQHRVNRRSGEGAPNSLDAKS